ncbi:hypothetical protein PR048_017732 [Dryococelus australis]|uniref:Uncharacterized protein n=1 Tax=Dryococelus australis TaxID=614101 RepID=A0ABQ9HAL1_9NEOP|nr:hypothetical protein PR048_017732 [Dryococelus australis]
MAAIATAHLRLQRAENCLHRASLLIDQSLNDPSQQRLFQATCQDLSSIKTSFEDDHILIEGHDDDAYFNKLEHSKRIEKLDDIYYKVTGVTESLKQLSVLSEQRTTTQFFDAKGVPLCIITPSRKKEPLPSIQTLVLPQITSYFPSTFLKPDAWDHIRQLQLADPTFATPEETDILLGAEIFIQFLTGKKVTTFLGIPTVIDMLLGLVLMGLVQINTDLQPGISSISNVQQLT